jgi:hypothetical protein
LQEWFSQILLRSVTKNGVHVNGSTLLVSLFVS